MLLSLWNVIYLFIYLFIVLQFTKNQVQILTLFLNSNRFQTLFVHSNCFDNQFYFYIEIQYNDEIR